MKGKVRLGNRILLFVSLIFIIAMGLILNMTVKMISNYNNSVISEEVKNGVTVLAKKVKSLQESSAGFAQLAADDQEISAAIQNSDAGKLDSYAKNIHNSTKTDFVIFTDKDGRFVAGVGQKSNSSNLRINPVVEKALKGDIITTVESAITAHFSALTAAPVKDSNGTVAGVVIIGYLLDNQSIIDDISHQVETDVTIFQGNTRINTTIEKDGVRQVGTQLSEAVTKVVIEEGKDYDGKADILGSEYLCSYRPLKNHNGDIVGVLFAGKSMETVNQLARNIYMASWTVAAITIIVILVGLILYLRNVVTKPLKKVVSAAETISEGVLDVQIDVKSKNEIGILADAFTKMADKLNDLIRQVSESSDRVAAASKDIASSSVTLSEGSAEQAATMQELSASSMEVLSMTQNNDENAKNASKLSEAVKDRCTEGNEKMKELLKAMEGINASSKKISKIIKVIDEIAYQTNLLALNAAVEAVQAGQYGKGFAVVADNVKRLADKSAKAAKEISQIIEESVVNAESGTELANETASILAEIFENINEVNVMVNDISRATTEQSVGISQMNTAIERMANILQSYSSMVEESSAASAKLSEQADLMKQQVSLFKLREQE